MVFTEFLAALIGRSSGATHAHVHLHALGDFDGIRRLDHVRCLERLELVQSTEIALKLDLFLQPSNNAKQ